MQTLTLEITNDNAYKMLEDLVEKNFIKILAKPDLNAIVFPGQSLSEQEFKDWIAGRESGSTISLKKAKTAWASKRKQLLKHSQ